MNNKRNKNLIYWATDLTPWGVSSIRRQFCKIIRDFYSTVVHGTFQVHSDIIRLSADVNYKHNKAVGNRNLPDRMNIPNKFSILYHSNLQPSPLIFK